ncbi:MAG: ABC transporter substrate-binding protein [Proteobacteria bacterium]|nr:ABC transporter substrate-binding protein [Pseudomonadota bacterium]
MMVRRRDFLGPWLPALFIAALVAAGWQPGPARADEFSDGAKKFIEILTTDAISMLTVENISKTERADRFRRLMNKNFAIKGIAKFVLGRHWRKASEAEKKEYLLLFEDLLVVTYADRFAKYSGEKLLVNESEVRGKGDALVHTIMIRVDGAKPLKVAWRVRGKAGNYKIVDIMVEGISMVVTQKSEFASFIRKNGGSLGPLLMELRKRIQANI